MIFSPREISILLILGAQESHDHSNKYLAQRLGLVEGTTKIYIMRLMAKSKLDRIGLALVGYVLWMEKYGDDRKKAEIQKFRERSSAALTGKPSEAPAQNGIFI